MQIDFSHLFNITDNSKKMTDVQALEMCGELSRIAFELSLPSFGYEEYGGNNLDSCIMSISEGDRDAARGAWLNFQAKFYASISKCDLENTEVVVAIDLVQKFFPKMCKWMRSQLGSKKTKEDNKSVTFAVKESDKSITPERMVMDAMTDGMTQPVLDDEELKILGEIDDNPPSSDRKRPSKAAPRGDSSKRTRVTNVLELI